MEHEISVHQSLVFDEEKEKDIIELLEELKERHKLSKFIELLIKVVVDNPELLQDRTVVYSYLNQLDNYKLTQRRSEFFKDCKNKLDELNTKIDRMYEMSYRTYMIALAGKKLGLDKSSENHLRVEFLLEQNLKEIYRELGITNRDIDRNEDKIEQLRTLTEEAFGDILTSYSDIVEELKNDTKSIVVNNNTGNNVVVKEEVKEFIPTVVGKAEDLSKDNIVDEGEQLIDFGNVDLDLLNDFFGD